MSRLRRGLAVQLLSLVLVACTATTPTPHPESTRPGSTVSLDASIGAEPSTGAEPTPGPTVTPESPGPIETAAPEPQPATASDQIVAAMESGEIDFPTSLLYRMYAEFGDPRLPAEFDGLTGGEDDAAVVVASDPNIELPDDIRALMATYLVRPTDPLSAFSGAREPVTGELPGSALAMVGGPVAALACKNGWASQNASVPIKIWARCTGNYEADIGTAVAVANSIYGPVTGYMGVPVLDLGTDLDGEDTSIDVYLTNETACPPEIVRCVAITRPTAAGQAHPDFPYGQPPARPSSAWVTLRRSRMNDPDDFRRTFIHEFFHVLQYARTSTITTRPTGRLDKDGNEIREVFWFSEASATWSEYYFERKAGHGASAKTVARDWFVNGYQFTDASLNAPSPGLRRYEAYIWPFFMVQETNETVIASVWQTLADATDWDDAMSWISSYLSFETYFRDFAVRNININVAGAGKDPIHVRFKDYDTAIPFPDGQPGGSMWHSVLNIDVSDDPVPHADTIKPLSAHYWHFKVAENVKKFEFDFSGLGDMGILDVDALLAIRQDGPGSEIKWEHRKLPDPEAKFCRSIPEEDVAEMYLVLSNHEREAIDLNGQFTVDASEEPCRGYEVTIVRETTGGPWDPTKMTLTAILEPDEEGEDDGLLEARGRGFGNYLGGDMEEGCKQFGYGGVIYMNGQIIGEDLNVYATPEDPFFLAIFGGKAPEKGGTVVTATPPELQPGEPATGIPSCYAWSRITESVTVKPLQPEQ